jgi:long-chain acyl-CoA synthetase
MVANVLQICAWSEPAFRSVPAGEPLLTVCALPLYHIFALTVCFLFSVRVGGINLLIVNPRDIDGFVKELRKYKIHSFPASTRCSTGSYGIPTSGTWIFHSCGWQSAEEWQLKRLSRTSGLR